MVCGCYIVAFVFFENSPLLLQRLASLGVLIIGGLMLGILSIRHYFIYEVHIFIVDFGLDRCDCVKCILRRVCSFEQ